MAVLRDIGNTALTIDTTSKAARLTRYDADGRETAAASKYTYSAANTFSPAATPTDIVMIRGSATKTIRVISMYLTFQNTAATGSGTFFVIKRGNPNQGGTFIPATMVSFDSTDGAATATLGHYTVNPTFLGQTLGTINVIRVASGAVTPTAFPAGIEEAGFEVFPWGGDKLPTLRGLNESFVINYNSAALLTGQVHTFRITWIEE